MSHSTEITVHFPDFTLQYTAGSRYIAELPEINLAVGKDLKLQGDAAIELLLGSTSDSRIVPIGTVRPQNFQLIRELPLHIQQAILAGLQATDEDDHVAVYIRHLD